MLKRYRLTEIGLAYMAAFNAGPVSAGPCDVLRAASSELESISAQTNAVCETDMTLTGPCSQAIVAEHKALDRHKIIMERCRAAIDASKEAMEGRP